ncbi:MAG: hypothetical protein GY720_13765, partial [bacterium]|nr:hypothetical protein [bacterium]
MVGSKIATFALLLAASLLPVGAAGADDTADSSDHKCEGANATLVGTVGDDVLEGTAGDDVIVGLGGDDVIKGKAGDDIICAGDGDDVVAGGKGSDRILGGAGSDVIRGRGGNDSLQGQDGDDWLIGNAGDDRLNGGGDNDACDGSGGADVADPSCDLRLNVETVEATCDLLPYADLRSCDLSNANLDRLDLTGVNFSGGTALNVSMVETVFDGADLSGAELSARFNAASRASFVGTNLSGAHIGSLSGSGLDFTDANLAGLVADGQRNSANQAIELSDSVFVGADLNDAKFGKRSAALNSDFTEANLSGFTVDFVSGSFDGAIVSDMTVNRLDATGLAGRTVERLTCVPVGRYQTEGDIKGAFNNTAFVGYTS